MKKKISKKCPLAEPTKVPAKMGRPTDYEPRFCDMLEKHMEEGLSFEAFAGVVGVSKQTLFTWAEKHSDFLDSKKRGQAKSLLWWESQGKKGMWDETSYNENGKPDFKKTLNSTVWIFNMKNRHKWRDRHEIEAEINGDEAMREKIRRMPMSELAALIKQNLPEDN